MDLSIQVQQKNNEYVATCPELDVHCFGPNREKATSRLKQVIQFYFDSAQDFSQMQRKGKGAPSMQNSKKNSGFYPVFNDERVH